AASPRVGELLDRIDPGRWAGAGQPFESANLRLIRRLHARALKVPRRLVGRLASTVTLAQDAWREAREQASFSLFQPWLEQVVRLKREEAQALGTPVAYDSLLDEFEPGFTSAQLDALFVPLEREVRRVLDARLGAQGRRRRVRLRRRVPGQAQQEFALEVIRAIGFDPDRGRVDPAAHPSTIAVAPGDVRITTRTS